MYRQDYLIFVTFKNKKQETRYFDFYSEEEAKIMTESLIKAYLLPVLLDKEVEKIEIKKTIVG